MKVFVSGTSTDLGFFRRAVAKQLKLLGAESVEQEYFEPDHKTLPTTLKNKVKACDAVICLIGSVFGAAPPNSNKSYTQMEYDFARELSKPTFVFFPSEECAIPDGAAGHGSDSPEQCDLQRGYADGLRGTSDRYYEFDSSDNLLAQVSQVIFRIWFQVAAGPTARMVRADFPTPLATKFDHWTTKDDLTSTRFFLTDLLRFITLLAAHDSLVHRSFGERSADRRERISGLAKPSGPAEWRTLLRLACSQQTDSDNLNFVGELADWENRNASALDKVVEYDQLVMRGRNSQAERMYGDLRTAMGSVLSDLEFLQRYVLVAVTDIDDKPGKCSATILRGLEARTFELTRDLRSFPRPQIEQLFLLDVHRSRALWLSPAFQNNGGSPECQVYMWDGLDPTDSRTDSECLVAAMRSIEDDTISIPLAPDMLAAWVGEDLVNDAFGFHVQPSAPEWRGKLFDDEAWNRLRQVVLPLGEPSVLGDRFRLLNEPLHRGLHANIFEAEDLAAGDPDSDKEELVVAPRRPVVHVLREESAADEEACTWFVNRSECWRGTAHPQVLKLYDSGDPAGTKGLPFLVTDVVLDARRLDELAPPGASVDATTLMKTVTLAAEVCAAAHRRGIFLMALPPRHFLMDGNGRLLLTGFESATAGTGGAEFPPLLLKRLSRFSSDVEMMSPEVRRDFGTFAPTLDVFAIGSLVAQLQKVPAHAMPVLPTREWHDPWRCLVYHCLATDPTVRFQSAEQLLMFLREWPPCTQPRTVSLPRTATEPEISVGKYPVTNAEYRQFCTEKDYPLPLHLRPQEEEPRAELSRLCGPWLPVTYVSLLDAREYCDWLSKRTGMKWRLPTEAEWLRAAVRRDDDVYPWGNTPPDRGWCNHGGYYRGPTVVGGFPRGQSYAGCWDMAGNVWEWCTDFGPGAAPRRLVKGGAYDYSAESLTLTGGDARVIGCRSPHIGFRVLCEGEI